MVHGSKLRVRLMAGAVMAAAPGAALAGNLVGTVSDGTQTRTLASAQVTLVELGRSLEADGDGRYRFTDVPAGTYTLRARYSGAPIVDASITVPGEGTLTRDIVLGSADDNTILVVGQSANLTSALSRQRGADGVESVLTRDAIGQFPDQNVAESIRRAPGVNVLNDQGEGRFVAVRGLDPSLNASSINGVRVPSPEADIRSVALDVVASELVESIEIKKSLTPDMDGDTIGASIEINTTSAFDRTKNLLAASIEGSYNDYSDKLTPKGSIDFSTRITDNFGIAGGASYYKRKFETDNIEAEDWTTTDDGVDYAEKLEYRDYDVTRVRKGGSLSLDWRPMPSTKLYARGIYNEFADQEYRRRLAIEPGEAVSGTGSTAGFDSEEDRIRIERDLKDRYEVQKIQSYQIGGETDAGPWNFKYQGAFSQASERENGSIDPIVFRSDFEEGSGVGLTIDYGDYTKPLFDVTSGKAAFDDPSNYEFDKIERTTLSAARDREWTFRADVTRSFALDQGSFDIQFGGKARLRKKTYDLTSDVFDGYAGNGDYTLADLAGGASYRLIDIGIVPPKGKTVADLLNSNPDLFELNLIDTALASAVSDYRVDEDIYAGYLLGRYEAGPLRVIGGVRIEQTHNDLRGNSVNLILADEEDDDGQDVVDIRATRKKRQYTNWLPSALVRYEANDKLVLRLGAFKSIVRPSIGQLAPRYELEESSGGDIEGTVGNPDLKPYSAWNIDAGAEWYFASASVLQGGFFYKSIKDYIVEQTLQDSTVQGIDFNEVTTYFNADTAKIKGFEFGYSQSFRMLPAPFDGLLASLNYTFTDADGKIPDGDGGTRRISLLNSSRHTINGVIGYEKGPITLRIAGTYRAGYLDELGETAEEDRHVRNHFQIDASARFRVTPNIQVFGELVNINNAKYVAYQNRESVRRLLQYEEYSFTAKFGVRANF